MKQTNNEIFREAIETFGEDNQLFQLCEEMRVKHGMVGIE